MVDLLPVKQAVIDGDDEKTVQLVREALEKKADPAAIVTSGLQAGLIIVGDKFSSGEFFIRSPSGRANPGISLPTVLSNLFKTCSAAPMTAAGSINSRNFNAMANSRRFLSENRRLLPRP